MFYFLQGIALLAVIIENFAGNESFITFLKFLHTKLSDQFRLATFS